MKLNIPSQLAVVTGLSLTLGLSLAQAQTIVPGGAISPRTVGALLTKSANQDPADAFAADIQAKGLSAALVDPSIIAWHQRPFTVELKKIGGITDQANTGDCWIYATLNAFKTNLIASGKVGDDFEFSKNYVYFYSMIEKVNTYLEDMIAERVQSISSRKFRTDFRLASDAPEYLISDGGEFAWMRFLAVKYGMVPESAMPATKVTLDDGLMLTMIRNDVLVTAKQMIERMHHMGAKLTPANLKELRQLKLAGESKVLSVLRLTLGTPPDEQHAFQFAGQSYTPQSFMKFANLNPLNYVSISTTPLRPYGKAYMIQEHKSIGIARNNEPGFDLRYVNEDTDRIADLVKKAIDAGQAIYFGAYVDNYVSASGAMDTSLFKIDPFLNPATPTLSLKDQMHAGLIYSDHAMAFVGYETESSGKIIRFKVENSWGTQVGAAGYFSMARDWFDIFVQEIAIDQSLVDANELKEWQTPNPIAVKTYDDYFGTE